MQDLMKVPVEIINTRYLAWLEDPHSSRWRTVLRRKAGLTENRAEAILRAESLTSSLQEHERKSIVEGFNVEGDTFATARLFGLSAEETAKANISYLIGSMPRGGQKEMAEQLGVAEESVSRWSRGKKIPTPKHGRAILRYLGLDPDTDIRQVPLFLSFEPVGRFAQRDWLHKRLDTLEPDELTRLFGALEKLLR